MTFRRLTMSDLSDDLLDELHARFENLTRVPLDARQALAIADHLQPLATVVHEVGPYRAELRVLEYCCAQSPDDLSRIASRERPALIRRLGPGQALPLAVFDLYRLR